ncbi:pyridoxine/pyridoxamine 5'-phosphate oxidase [Thalassotalea ganghwensis]
MNNETVVKEIVQKFHYIWQKAKLDSPLTQKSAVCISTIDEQGFPQSRFVDLKAVNEQGFIFCTAYDSAKGQQLATNPKIALTAWWDHIGEQVRVVGVASKIADNIADSYWATRNSDAQLASLSFKQSQEWHQQQSMEHYFNVQQQAQDNQPIERPATWGGYLITPITIEFLTFKESRVHTRELYRQSDQQWHKSMLQP